MAFDLTKLGQYVDEGGEIIQAATPIISKIIDMIESAANAPAEKTAAILAKLQAADKALDDDAEAAHATYETESAKTRAQLAASTAGEPPAAIAAPTPASEPVK